MGFEKTIEQSLEVDRRRLTHFRRQASTTVEGRLNSKWDRKRECLNYYLKKKTDQEEHYVKTAPNSSVWKLQCKRFAEEMIHILELNIEAKEECLRILQPDNEADVLGKMHRSYRPNPAFRPNGGKKGKPAWKYGIHKDHTGPIPQSRNPYKPEERNISTSFGLWVRTKGELSIAELLYSLGIVFFYEQPLSLNVWRKRELIIDGEVHSERYQTQVTYYPDFTILLPDGRIFYWEHKGLLKLHEYNERDIQKTVDYNINGIYQPHNFIVTEEGPNNDLDMEAVKGMVCALLLS